MNGVKNSLCYQTQHTAGWENAIYDYDRKLGSQEREEKRKSKLKGYRQ